MDFDKYFKETCESLGCSWNDAVNPAVFYSDKTTGSIYLMIKGKNGWEPEWGWAHVKNTWCGDKDFVARHYHNRYTNNPWFYLTDAAYEQRIEPVLMKTWDDAFNYLNS